MCQFRSESKMYYVSIIDYNCWKTWLILKSGLSLWTINKNVSSSIHYIRKKLLILLAHTFMNCFWQTFLWMLTLCRRKYFMKLSLNVKVSYIDVYEKKILDLILKKVSIDFNKQLKVNYFVFTFRTIEQTCYSSNCIGW